jgi:hypothetical protein
MGREVRRVPANWEHPKNEYGNYQPMHNESFSERANEWKQGFLKWENGERPDYCDEESKNIEYWEWDGDPPNREYYMPVWTDEEKTHYQMYETTSEGTPLSPPCATPEELAKYLADNGASSFGDDTATYDQWLGMIRHQSCPTAFIKNGKIMSGVQMASEESQNV